MQSSAREMISKLACTGYLSQHWVLGDSLFEGKTEPGNRIASARPPNSSVCVCVCVRVCACVCVRSSLHRTFGPLLLRIQPLRAASAVRLSGGEHGDDGPGRVCVG